MKEIVGADPKHGVEAAVFGGTLPIINYCVLILFIIKILANFTNKR